MFTGSDNLLEQVAMKVTGKIGSGDNLLEQVAKKATGNFFTMNLLSYQ